ncbi:arrestin domain-containing protein 5 [Hemicordylus capensis]|uniref:arrestin domain-containing protein 5 n=1 Tax=Hemicordylus capensis TaxID=884348 RepID=UPI002304290A|nr:arrestin domain-containing protein 5 [Hemicordylus capensis]
MTVVKSIELVIPNDVYISGSTVEGQLVLSLHNTLVDPLLKVELIGRGYLEWIEEDNVYKDYSRPATCVNKADYVQKSKTFKVKGNWLGPGVHTFDFHFVLPPRIPSTFSSRIGRVSYFLQALCATRELILGKQTKYLLVQGTSIFHQDDVESESPLEVEVEKVLSYNCCFKSAPISLHISLNKNVFAPGDNITFTTQIINPTGKSIKKVIFTLLSVVLYKGVNLKAENRTLEVRDEIARLESHINRGSCAIARIHSVLSLPKVMPVTSSPKMEGIMDIAYELTGAIYFPWCMNSVVAKIPIVVRYEAVIPDE